jgi:hypothetical protein
VKGSLEEKISDLSFEQCIIFRPGLLLRKNTDRAGERISGAVLKFLNSLGLIKKFRPYAYFLTCLKNDKGHKTSFCRNTICRVELNILTIKSIGMMFQDNIQFIQPENSAIHVPMRIGSEIKRHFGIFEIPEHIEIPDL